MPGGIRATVAFSDPSICPITRVTATNSIVSSVSRNTALPSAAGSVTEFLSDVEPDEVPDDVEVTPVFSYGPKHLYRFTHEGEPSCPCEFIGQHGCPIDRYSARDGSLTIAFHATDFAQLQDVIGALRGRYPEMDIRRLLRSSIESDVHDHVLVDRSTLTDRQLEVLRTAYTEGYFDRPRRANANEIAEKLGINPSTLTEHLAAAQTKLFRAILEEG